MDNNVDIIELLDTLYGMVTEAWSVPLGTDKCVIERDKAVDIINRIKESLPVALAEAKRLTAARDEFIGNAKREAEAMRKSAEEKSNAMVEEQEIVRIARAKSAEMLNNAELKSNELRRVASEYVEEIMSKTEMSVNEALAKLQTAHSAFKSMGTTVNTANSANVRKPQTPTVSPEKKTESTPKFQPPVSTAAAPKRQGVPIVKLQRDN